MLKRLLKPYNVFLRHSTVDSSLCVNVGLGSELLCIVQIFVDVPEENSASELDHLRHYLGEWTNCDMLRSVSWRASAF